MASVTIKAIVRALPCVTVHNIGYEVQFYIGGELFHKQSVPFELMYDEGFMEYTPEAVTEFVKKEMESGYYAEFCEQLRIPSFLIREGIADFHVEIETK